MAPTVIKQQQRQKDGHPLLLDPPVPHGKLPEGMCKQALQTKAASVTALADTRLASRVCPNGRACARLDL